jgi:malate dehydrogenase
MVPMPKACTVNGVGIGELMDRATVQALSDRTRHGGAEIVNLLRTGSAYYAPASSTVAMAAAILNDEKRLLPCSCFLNGQYGVEGIYTGVPAVLGRTGVERIVELSLDTEARIQMQKTVAEIEKDLGALRDLGLL